MRTFFKTNLSDIRDLCNIMDKSVKKVFPEFNRAYIGNGNYYYMSGSNIEAKVVYKESGCTIDLYCNTNLDNNDTVLFSELETSIISTFTKGNCKIERLSIESVNYAERYKTSSKDDREDILKMCRCELAIVKRNSKEYNIVFVSSDQETGAIFHIEPLCEFPLSFPSIFRSEEYLSKEVKILFHAKSAKLFDASTSGDNSIDFSELQKKIFADEYLRIMDF